MSKLQYDDSGSDEQEEDFEGEEESPGLGLGADVSEGESEDGQGAGAEGESEEDERGQKSAGLKTVDAIKQSLLDKAAQQKLRAFDPFKNAPKLVVVQGPPKSGKTTLIRSLIKHYTGQSVKDPRGPITIKTSNKQRITLVECPNDISRMTDFAKVPDVLLCLVDASLGFEMQTFEFCAIMQIHGFPKCLGVATHMDFYKENKKKRRVKKLLKKRFEIEVSKDTKMFFTNGFQNGQYLYKDAHNIARYLSVMNPREAEFKQTHPHVLVDRFDLLSAENRDLSDNSLVDVALFGYCRGNAFLRDQSVFLTGLGFLKPSAIEEANDPVKLTESVAGAKGKEKEESSAGEEAEAASDEEAAPAQCRSAGKSQSKSIAKVAKMRKSLKKFEKVIYAPQSNIGMTMFDETGDYVTIPDKYVVFTKTENQTAEIAEHEGVKMMRDLQRPDRTIKDQLASAQTFLVDGVLLGDEQAAAENPFLRSEREVHLVSELAHKVADDREFQSKNEQKAKRGLQALNFRSLIYGPEAEGTLSNFAKKTFDCHKYYSKKFESLDYYKDRLRPKFVTGYQDFENSEGEGEDEDDFQRVYQNAAGEGADEQFGTETADKIAKGKYVKVVVRGIRFSAFKNFADNPLVLSQFLYGENSRGFLLVKFKRHRFYRSILKSGDPIILSIGLHKFQTLPYFCMKDPSERMRFLKYTPKYDFCLCAFYSNYLPNGMGVVAYQSLDEGLAKFRVAGTGVVVGFSNDYKIKKKLKLVGEPYKVFKNTAFVKGMFNSELEVSKFVGAKVKTVSGIRGQIKKAVREAGEEGAFRASFEDKVIMSDIVFLRTWYNIPLEKFYNPIVSFDSQVLLRTTWQLRRKLGIENKEAGKAYPEIERPNKRFSSLRLPKSVAAELPFKTRAKNTEYMQQKTAMAAENKLVKTLSTDKEKEARYFIQRLKLIEKERKKADTSKHEEKRRWKEKWEAGMNKKFAIKKKAAQKAKYKEMGKRRRNDE